MAPLTLLVLLFFFLSVVRPSSAAQQRPRALVLPVSKDPSTLQYTVLVGWEGAPSSAPVALTLDLNAPFSWLDCDGAADRVSVPCRSAQCAAFDPHGCGSDDKACLLRIQNPFTRSGTSGRLTQGTISIPSTDGSNPGAIADFRRFLFACAPNPLLKGLPSGVKGVAGLGRTQVSLPSQLSAAFSFKRKFALCLFSSSPSDTVSGIAFFGDGPYKLLPDKVVSDYLTYTPLLIKNRGEYHIGVKSIRIGEKPVPLLNTTTLLSAGAKLSTVDPYTVLESSIYSAVAEAFTKESNLTRVAPVAPFKHCYDARGIGVTRAGAAVPAIELVLQSESVAWWLYGADSMVPVRDGVLCLGFVDGGPGLDAPVVIGGYQMENHLLQFDAAASRLGFSPSLLFFQTTCANFNFTTSSASDLVDRGIDF